MVVKWVIGGSFTEQWAWGLKGEIVIQPHNYYLINNHTMAKFIVALFALAVVCSAVDPFAEVKSIIQKDECSLNQMEALKPKLQKQIDLLKQNKNDLRAKAELLALINQAKEISEECHLNDKVQPALGDVVEASGVGFLLASNCFKDVGIVLLLADTIIQAPTEWVNDVIVLIFTYILGLQGYKDCSQFVNFIVG